MNLCPEILIFPAIIICLGLTLASCKDHNTGVFQVRITGIPADIMADGLEGAYLFIILDKVNSLFPQGNYIAESWVFSSSLYHPEYPDEFGSDWCQFYFNEPYLRGRIYFGLSGNYDIWFLNYRTDTSKVLRNVWLEIDQLNIFAYSSFMEEL